MADIDRLILVGRKEGVYRAWTEIGGVVCLVEKMFIHSEGSGLGTRVNYIEFHGAGVDSGEPCYEKLEP